MGGAAQRDRAARDASGGPSRFCHNLRDRAVRRNPARVAKGQKKTGGRQKGSRNKRTQEREEAPAQAVALIGEAIPDAFAGDAHAFLVAVYKNPRIDHHTRQDAAKAALPYEKPRLQAVTLANEGGEPLKMRSEPVSPISIV